MAQQPHRVLPGAENFDLADVSVPSILMVAQDGQLNKVSLQVAPGAVETYKFRGSII